MSRWPDALKMIVIRRWRGISATLRSVGKPSPGFRGRFPAIIRPTGLYDAIDGLASCYEALGKPAEAKKLRDLADRWSGGRRG